VTCGDDTLEVGIEKIALYADGGEYMHAARQIETGKWTSKIGFGEDIEHDTPADLAGPAFGQVAAYMNGNGPKTMKTEPAADPSSLVSRWK